MAGLLQPLDEKFAIVGGDGRPTLYFIKWAQQRQIDISGGITEADLAAYLTAHKLQEGIGIQITPSGDLTDSPTIAADVQEILDTLSATRGTVIYRGLLGWTVLLPGAAGLFLRTNGAGTDPSWAAAGGGGAIPSVVQSAAAAAPSGAYSATFGVAPTAGNLLVALGGDWLGAGRVDGAGWFRGNGNQPTQSNDTGFFYWKVAGSGESTTQTVSSSSSQWQMVMWEIAGSSPSDMLNSGAFFTQVAATALSINAGVPKSNSLCLGVFSAQLGGTNPTITLGAGPTADATANNVVAASGSPRIIAGFHELKNVGAWGPTATLSAARVWGKGHIVLGGA